MFPLDSLSQGTTTDCTLRDSSEAINVVYLSFPLLLLCYPKLAKERLFLVDSNSYQTMTCGYITYE